MRFVYMDEAGISNPAQEPYMVVAGVLVNPDKQWKELDAYYRNLAADLFPDEVPYRFVFHAHHIWHGSGDFARKQWTFPQRMRLLAQLAQVPKLFDLPVVAGIVQRHATRQAILSETAEVSERSVRFQIYVEAFVGAVKCVDYWMRMNTPDEVAMLIAEDMPEVKSGIRLFHEGYTYPAADDAPVFRSNHIVDAVHYAKKKNHFFFK